MSDKIRTQIYLEKEQHDELTRVAARKSVTMAHLIREAVTAYLTEEEASGLDEDAYLNDPIWQIPEIAEQFEGTGWIDAAENHDHYIYERDRPYHEGSAGDE